MRHPSNILIAALLLAAPAASQGLDPAQAAQAPGLPAPVDDGRGTPYVVDKSDNICGIDEPRAITNPAKVDYDDLLAATPEVQKIQRKRIDPESAEGIKLMTTARRKVLSACETVRASEGYCSVWKSIRRRDGQKIPDVTALVKAEIDSLEEEA